MLASWPVLDALRDGGAQVIDVDGIDALSAVTRQRHDRQCRHSAEERRAVAALADHDGGVGNHALNG